VARYAVTRDDVSSGILLTFSSGTAATAEMAFPIPAQLPREHDVSSQILSKLDAATYGTLNSALVSTWLNELDESIQTTKVLFCRKGIQ